MTSSWAWAAAKAAGTSHLAQGLPCQDSYACRLWTGNDGARVLVAVLADGAGSAEKAEIGASMATSLLADIVCDAFTDGAKFETADAVLRDAISETKRAIGLTADHHGRDANDYASTLIAAILTPNGCVVGQIGDGAAVIRNGTGDWQPVHWPDHGEYANTTCFLTQSDALELLRVASFTHPIARIALFSDGLERLVLDFKTRSAHAPFFDSIFERLSTSSGYDVGCSEALADLLASDRVNARTDDDKSLVCAALAEA